MTKHVLFVFTDPVEGREDEYNKWYNDVHLPEVLGTPGFARAQRFKVDDTMPGVTDHAYVAIYEMETDDPKGALDALAGRRKQFTMSDAINLKDAKTTLATECSELVEAAG